MARELDRILVIDVESTCWEGAPPPGQENEIIEIGLCVLDATTGKREARESVLVRPEKSEVSAFCTELTTLTAAQVTDGMPFADACKMLASRYHGKQRVFASYGDYDRRQFERQCTARGVAYPLGATHLNVKNLFALSFGLSREVGMSEALQLANLPLEGTHHRGGDDAWNIAGLLALLLKRLRSREKDSS